MHQFMLKPGDTSILGVSVNVVIYIKTNFIRLTYACSYNNIKIKLVSELNSF